MSEPIEDKSLFCIFFYFSFNYVDQVYLLHCHTAPELILDVE